jgi:hypothetical protein
MCSLSITLSISCVLLVGMSRTFQGKLGLQFNGHTTGDGELILRHAGLGHLDDFGRWVCPECKEEVALSLASDDV